MHPSTMHACMHASIHQIASTVPAYLPTFPQETLPQSLQPLQTLRADERTDRVVMSHLYE